MVLSRLDYSGGLLGLPGRELRCLPLLQNTAARIVTLTKKPPLASSEGSYWPQDSFAGVQLLQWHSSKISSRADSLLWTTMISSIIFSVSSYSSCRWKPYPKAVFFNSAPRLWNALPQALREPESSSAFRRKRMTHWFSKQWSQHHPSLLFLCLCFPWLIIWQRDCPIMRDEHGFSMDVWALFKMTLIISVHCRRVHKCLASSWTYLPIFAFQFPCTTRMPFFGVWSMIVCIWSASISFHRVQGCSIRTCPFYVLVHGVSPQLLVSLCSNGDIVSCTNVGRRNSGILDTSLWVYGGRRGPCWPGRRPIRCDVVVGCHFIVTLGRGTTWRTQSLCRSSKWPLSSSWNLCAHLFIVFELWGHPPSDAPRLQQLSNPTDKVVVSLVGWILLNPSVCWFYTDALGLILFQITTFHSEVNLYMCVCVCLYVEPVFRSKDLEQKLVLLYVCTNLCRRVCLKWRVYMALWWSLCLLYLLACQVELPEAIPNCCVERC